MRKVILGALAFMITVNSPGIALARDKATTKVTNVKAMSDLSHVIVSSFAVAFVTDKTDAAFAGSRRSGKAMGAIAKARLAGVSSADFQAITDAAYADFAQHLAAAGFKLGDRAAMVAAKEMAKVQYVASGTEGTLAYGKDSKAKAVFYGPSAFGPTPLLKGETGDTGVATGGGMFSALKSFSSLGGPQTAKVMYAAMNGQPTVSVLYVIDFADADRYSTNYTIDTSKATVELTASLAVVETMSTLSTINAKGALASIALTQPVAVPGNFGKMQDSTTSGQRLDNVAGALIGGLLGSGSNSYKHIIFTADPEKYRVGAISAATATNALVVTELAARR